MATSVGRACGPAALVSPPLFLLGRRDSMRKALRALPLVAVAALVVTAVAGAFNPDTRVTVGNVGSPFPQNKQNEPAVAVNPAVPNIVAAGANDELDIEACNNRTDVT